MSKRTKKTKVKPQFPSLKTPTRVTQADRSEKIHYRLLLACVVLFVLHYMFFEVETLGHDERYYIYILAMPVLMGCLILVIYQWRLLKDVYKEVKSIKDYTIACLFIPMLGFMISYFTLGNLANITWNYLNKREANLHMPEVFNCPIDRLIRHYESSDQIYFIFQDKHESVNASYESIKPYLDANLNNYELEVVARKGI